MRVEWDELDPQRYEEMVAVLLSRLDPRSQRIDGRGGDGGRDVQIRDQAGHLDVFELKSFVGRMNKSRRKQVEQSLKRAAELRPRQWTLVVPIDPNPAEKSWFERLEEDHEFPCVWRGKTWLDGKMAEYPDIRKYFCGSKNDEVVELLLELQREEAKITDVLGAVGRLERLRDRLNEIDPYYRYEMSTGIDGEYRAKPGVVLSVGTGNTRVDIFEKYTGAAKDRPITASVEITIGPDEDALLAGVRSAFDYGLPVNIPTGAVSKFVLDAPGGLGGTFAGSELKIGATSVKIDELAPLRFNVIEGDDLLASLPVRVTRGTAGLKGIILEGSDETGWLQVSLKVNPSGHESGATLSLIPKPVMPAALVPLLRWLGTCRPPHRMTITSPDGLGGSSDIKEPLGDERFSTLVEALAYLQGHSGVYFPTSFALPHETQEGILESAALVRDGGVDDELGTINIQMKRWHEALDPLLEGESLMCVVESDMQLNVEGHSIPIGRIRTQIESARAADPEGLRRALADGLVPDIQLIPGNSKKIQRLLVA